jgi:hypothetical protein
MKEILQMKNKNDGGKWNYELYFIIFSKKKKKTTIVKDQFEDRKT